MQSISKRTNQNYALIKIHVTYRNVIEHRLDRLDRVANQTTNHLGLFHISTNHVAKHAYLDTSTDDVNNKPPHSH